MIGSLTIKWKLILLVMFLSLIAAAEGLLGLYGMKQGVAGLDTVYKDRVVPLRDLKMIVDAYAVNIVDTNHKVRNGNLSPEEGVKSLDYAARIIAEKWQAYRATYLVEEERRLVAEIEPLMKRGDEATAKLKSLLQAGDGEAIAAFSAQELYPVIDPISEAFSRLIEVQLDVARQAYEDNAGQYERLNLIATILLVVAATVGFLIALLLINGSVARPLAQAGEAVSAIARGDLTRPLPTAGGDEIGVMIANLTAMQAGLRELIAGIRRDIEVVGQAASELAASADASAAVTRDQSEAASGMAASVEQLSVSIDQVDEHAREANAITQSSGHRLEESGRIIHGAASGIRSIADAVNATAGTIRELEGYSGQISSIVGVIQDIADQTNLLALNAAIEAARAGEQGRGFAVVADEVRKLAERTTSSTQEIAGMIDKIQQGAQRAVAEMEAGISSVNAGVDLAHQAGDSVGGIREAGNRVSRAVGDIGQAIREQAMTARDIAQRVERIAQGAEENSAAVAQTAAAAGRLRGLAVELGGRVENFRV